MLVEMGALEPQRLARALAQEYRLPFQAHIDEHSLDSDLCLEGSDQLRQEEPCCCRCQRRRRRSHCGDRRPGQLRAARRPATCCIGAQIHPLVAPAEVIAEAINRAYDRASATSAQDLMIDLDEERLDVVASELASEPRDLLEVRRCGADHQAGQRLALAGGQGSRERHPYRSLRERNGGALPRGRDDVRRAVAAQALSAGDHARGSRSWRGSISPRSACRRTAESGCASPGRDIDVRVSSIPTAFGERIVLRLLDRAQAVVDVDLDHLGFSGDNLQRIDRLIRQSHGIILATGPTGSGKTTTLYACLSRINSPEKTSSRSRIRSSTSCAASARCRSIRRSI